MPFAVLRFGPAVRRACIGVREGELFPFDVVGGVLLIAALGSLGTLTGAAGSFARFTGAGATDAAMQAIVGTVSQSSGTPTGAIIETGTGTNGRFIKFAGTLICWGSADLSTNNINTAWAGGFRSSLIGIILPAAFVGSAIMSAWMSGSPAPSSTPTRRRVASMPPASQLPPASRSSSTSSLSAAGSEALSSLLLLPSEASLWPRTEF